MDCFATNWINWLIPMTLLTALFALQFPLAARRGMMTPKQMLAQGIRQGIPLTGHGSTWVSLFALNPLLSLFIATYWQQWTIGEHLEARLAGYAFSAIAHFFVYAKGKYPEAHVRNGKLEPAGYVHMIFFGEVVSTLVLIYMFTRGIPTNLFMMLTFYMTAHVWLGNHFVNRINKPEWFPSDYAFSAPDAWIPVVLVLCILVGSAWLNVRRNTTRSASNLWLEPIAIVQIHGTFVPSG